VDFAHQNYRRMIRSLPSDLAVRLAPWSEIYGDPVKCEEAFMAAGGNIQAAANFLAGDGRGGLRRPFAFGLGMRGRFGDMEEQRRRIARDEAARQRRRSQRQGEAVVEEDEGQVQSRREIGRLGEAQMDRVIAAREQHRREMAEIAQRWPDRNDVERVRAEAEAGVRLGQELEHVSRPVVLTTWLHPTNRFPGGAARPVPQPAQDAESWAGPEPEQEDIQATPRWGQTK
jgi:hypothetical protein